MATSLKGHNTGRIPEQVSVELSPEFYQAILDLVKANELSIADAEFFEILEHHLSETITRTVSEVTGIETPFPQGVDVELQVAQPDDEIDDDDEAVRASIRQGMRDVLSGDTLTEAEFWKAVADDE